MPIGWCDFFNHLQHVPEQDCAEEMMVCVGHHQLQPKGLSVGALNVHQ